MCEGDCDSKVWEADRLEIPDSSRFKRVWLLSPVSTYALPDPIPSELEDLILDEATKQFSGASAEKDCGKGCECQTLLDPPKLLVEKEHVYKYVYVQWTPPNTTRSLRIKAQVHYRYRKWLIRGECVPSSEGTPHD